MKFQELKKYLGLFILSVALIIVYKTFDNFNIILDFIGKIFSLLTPFFIGAGIAFVLRIPCKRVEMLLHKTKLEFLLKHRRGFAVLIIYLILLASIALIMFAIIPQLVESIKIFIEQVPGMLRSLVNWFNSLGIYTIDEKSVQNILNSNFFTFDEILKIFDFKSMNKYAQGVINVGSSLADIFIGIIISIYMLLERKQIKRAFSHFSRVCLPKKFRSNLVFYSRTIASFINRYIGCQLLDAVIVFLLCLIALSIMNVEYAGVIALMVGSFNLIPYFGAFIAITIAALITLITTGSFISTLVLLIILIVIQQIDANIIQPRLIANSLSIKPLLVILGVVLGGGLFGILGIFIGVPVVALLSNIISDAIDNRNASKIGSGDTGDA